LFYLSFQTYLQKLRKVCIDCFAHPSSSSGDTGGSPQPRRETLPPPLAPACATAGAACRMSSGLRGRWRRGTPSPLSPHLPFTFLSSLNAFTLAGSQFRSGEAVSDPGMARSASWWSGSTRCGLASRPRRWSGGRRWRSAGLLRRSGGQSLGSPAAAGRTGPCADVTLVVGV
jgi:hypothetical protein